jgi:hypothetical protein
VVVLSRGATAATRLFEESPLPVAYVRTVVALERTLEEQDIRIVFYVNQNTKNFQMFRYGQRWHVFINHGESDKMYMTTNQFKAYDYSFVAGDAAIARLRKVLWDYDFDKRAIRIGRPQADHYSGALPYTPDERTVVPPLTVRSPRMGSSSSARCSLRARTGSSIALTLEAASPTTPTLPRTARSSGCSPPRTPPTRQRTMCTTPAPSWVGSCRRLM